MDHKIVFDDIKAINKTLRNCDEFTVYISVIKGIQN